MKLRLSAIVFFVPLTLSQSIAEIVLVDHISNSINWSEEQLIAHQYPPGVPNGAFAAAATFTGDGGILKSVSGLFAHNSTGGVPNQGDPSFLDFRFSFFSSLDEFIADPFLEGEVSSPNVLHLYPAASNEATWLDVVGTSDDGHNLFVWEVDVEPLGIRTAVGETHLISLIPETNALSGGTFLASSNGMIATGGGIEDWFARRSSGATTLTDVGAAHPYAAYRITSIPEPSSAWLMLVVLFVVPTGTRIRRLRRAW